MHRFMLWDDKKDKKVNYRSSKIDTNQTYTHDKWLISLIADNFDNSVLMLEGLHDNNIIERMIYMVGKNIYSAPQLIGVFESSITFELNSAIAQAMLECLDRGKKIKPEILPASKTLFQPYNGKCNDSYQWAKQVLQKTLVSNSVQLPESIEEFHHQHALKKSI